MKPGDLVKILPRPWLGNRETIGMILEYEDSDPVWLIPAKVVVQGQITSVGKQFIKPLKKNTRVSKTK